MPFTQLPRRDGTFAGLGVALPVILAMTILVTWPQVLTMSSAFAAHVDSYFSAWRIMWIGHALQSDPPTRIWK